MIPDELNRIHRFVNIEHYSLELNFFIVSSSPDTPEESAMKLKRFITKLILLMSSKQTPQFKKRKLLQRTIKPILQLASKSTNTSSRCCLSQSSLSLQWMRWRREFSCFYWSKEIPSPSKTAFVSGDQTSKIDPKWFDGRKIKVCFFG